MLNSSRHKMAACLIRGTSGTKLCPLVFRSTIKSSRLKPETFRCRVVNHPHFVAACSVTVSHSFSSSPLRRAESASTPQKTSPDKVSAATSETLSETSLEDDVYREQYIPITRQSVIRHLVEEKGLLTDEERKIFPDFVRALDSALVNKYYGVLQELKMLFDPINPDKDTQKTREWTKRDKLDNEFWLLSQLEDVMAKANFHELPHKKVQHFLKDHDTREGVRVSVDPERYAVLRFWVLGHEIPELQLSLWERISARLFRQPPRKPMEYFKRVVVAMRLKKDSKLMLKAFKEVPIQNIEMLLPDGKVRIGNFDKSVLVTTAALAGLGVLAKTVTVLANMHVDWTLLLTLVTGTVGLRVWYSYRNKENSYLVDLTRMLYFKNIANNRGLLTLLVDRAQDESLKEALLTYMFLLTSQSADMRKAPESRKLPSHLGGLSESDLEQQVQKWLQRKTGVKVEFDSKEAIQILRKLGLLSEKYNKLHVLQLDAAVRVLPQSLDSVISRRAADADIAEGYDRDEYLETEEEYKAEEQTSKRYGWFR